MYANYQKVISHNLTLEEKNWYFKSDPSYNVILEHVHYDYGMKYLDEIKNKYLSFYITNKEYLIDICRQNDKYGVPKKNKFEDFCECSPTNLRYILHAIIILNHMKQNNLNNVDIVEIGGGYGGLALFLYSISSLFQINIKSYSVFDLPEVLELQKKYLDLFNIKINTFNINNIFTLNNDSFLISNYAFSEISEEYRNLYINNIINQYISHGFLVWNSIPVYQFIKNKTLDIYDEYPAGYNNKFIFF